MALAIEKRIHELIETTDKTDKYIALDQAGLSEAVKFNVNSFITQSQTDVLYVKVAGSESINGVKTWINQGVFQAGIELTAGIITVATAGNSTNWYAGYNHSLVVTGNPHAIDLADIGESKTSINYWTLSGSDVYYNTGYVGIGTTAPNSKLEVNGNISLAVAGFMGFTGNTTVSASNYSLFGNATLTYLNVASGGAIHFNIGNNTKMKVDSAGNVGIGTTSPNATLTINSSGIPLQINNASSSVRIKQEIVDDDGLITIWDTTLSIKVKLNSDGDSYFIGGNVGIGTATPTHKLDVAGAARFTKGRTPANTVHGSSTIQDLYDLLSPSIPVTNDEIIVSGGINVDIVSYAIRASSTVITLYSIDNAGQSSSTSLNGTSTTGIIVSLSW